MSYIEELFSLNDRVAIVTGGYGHLGRSMCWALAASGAKVFCAGPSQARFQQSFPLAISEGSRAITTQPSEMNIRNIIYLPLDLASKTSRKAALAQVQQEAGGLDILVNNAFYLSSDVHDFRSDMDGLLNSPVDFSERALDMLGVSDQGRVINITSMYGIVAPDPELYNEHPQYRSRASYNAAKAALLQLTRYWASFWGADFPQLTVNAISPGAFPRAEIQQNDSAVPSFCAKLSRRTIAGRTGKPEDLSGALLLLASQAGSYITGQNLIVDGGWTVC